MKKTELYNLQHQIRSLDTNVWDDWIDWRLEQAGIQHKSKIDSKWHEAVNSVPEIYDWDVEKEHICFTWIDGNGEKQREHVPLSVFVDDLDNQPDLEMLWHSGYYDGPLSGMARYKGEMVWFDCAEYGDWGESSVRTYTLYRLNEDVKDEIIRRHKLFDEMVGKHSNHHPDLYDDRRCTDENTFNEFYKISKKWSKFDHLECDKLGVFAYHQFKYYSRPC